MQSLKKKVLFSVTRRLFTNQYNAFLPARAPPLRDLSDVCLGPPLTLTHRALRPRVPLAILG